MTYNFGRQHRQGKDAEQFIYQQFQEYFNVIPAPGYLQDQGVDFTFTDRRNGQTWKVELKTDQVAYRTGNAFIETVSVSRASGSLPGWAHSSQADWLLYFIPQTRKIYRIALTRLRAELSLWEQRYPSRTIPNADRRGAYDTIGLLVPLTELQQISEEVIDL